MTWSCRWCLHWQTRPVTIYKLVSAGTVDEKIYSIAERKGHLANTMLGEGTDDAADQAQVCVSVKKDLLIWQKRPMNMSISQARVSCVSALRPAFVCVSQDADIGAGLVCVHMHTRHTGQHTRPHPRNPCPSSGRVGGTRHSLSSLERVACRFRHLPLSMCSPRHVLAKVAGL